MAKQLTFKSWMLRGHPGNVARPVKKLIVRGVNHNVVVTSTTDGVHATFSWHKIIAGRNKTGRAVDFGVKVPGTPEARKLLVDFQAFLLKRFGPKAFLELFGPDNELCVKNGVRIRLVEGTDLEQAHDNHDHCVPQFGGVPLPTPRKLTQLQKDRRLARKADVPFAFAIVREGRKADPLEISTCFALIQQESNFKHVWGGDPAPNGQTGGLRFKVVTKQRYAEYKVMRDKGGKGRGGMQGVGLGQLTFWSIQDEADRIGGCWKPRMNLRVAFAHLAFLVRSFDGDLRKALAVYNGGSANPNFRYADSVLALKKKWHDDLTS